MNEGQYQIDLIEVGNVLTLYKTRLEELVKRKIEQKDKIASGNLLASISTRVELDGVQYIVYLDSLKYLKFLETGTKPHWPPTEPILQWVRDKKLPTREYTGNKSLPTEKQVAYLVRKKISEKGTLPNYIIAETVEELNEEFMPLLLEALKTDIINSLPVIQLQLRWIN